MQGGKRIFDDAARMAGGAMGTLAGIRREMEALARQQFDRLLGQLDLVTRDEFDAVKEMAAAARAEQEALARRVAALESGTAPRKKTSKKAAKKATPRKTTGRKR